MDRSTATRRRPFAYDDSDSLPEALDEEEQESLIESLTAKNTTQNTTYKTLLSALPLIAILPALLNNPPTSPLARLLSLSCLLVTAYLAYTLPPETTGLSILDARAGRRDRSGVEASPARRYLPYLNLALAGVILLLGLVRGGGALAVAQGCLPALVYGVVIGAKLVMADVDPAELQRLKYDYKGA